MFAISFSNPDKDSSKISESNNFENFSDLSSFTSILVPVIIYDRSLLPRLHDTVSFYFE